MVNYFRLGMSSMAHSVVTSAVEWSMQIPILIRSGHNLKTMHCANRAG
jgi:hypothetical protein